MIKRTGKHSSERAVRKGAYAAIHSAAAGLHRAGGISKATMREYDELCIQPVRDVSARDVVRIRTTMNVSQNLFARYLNTSESTIQKWETGAKRPSSIAAKLLRVIEKHGLKVLA